MVLIRSLGADILPGDFLLAHRNQVYSSLPVVCQVKKELSPHHLEVVWWVESSTAPPLCPETFENLHRCRGREVFEDLSSMTSLHHDDVADIAFVFTADLLEHFWIDVAGMNHVFFTRQPHHQPFSFVDVTESYPSRIWFTLVALQEQVRRMMSYKRQNQLCQRTTTTMLSLEGWRYLVRRLQQFVRPIPLKSNVPKCSTFRTCL